MEINGLGDIRRLNLLHPSPKRDVNWNRVSNPNPSPDSSILGTKYFRMFQRFCIIGFHAPWKSSADAYGTILETREAPR